MNLELLVLSGLIMFAAAGLSRTRTDALRIKLFGIRHDLCVTAFDHQIPFGNPAYRFLRDQVNAGILAAESLAVPRLILAWLFMRKPITEASHSRTTQWEHALSTLRPEEAWHLRGLKVRADNAIAKHLVLSGWGLAILVVVAPFFLLRTNLVSPPKERIKDRMQGPVHWAEARAVETQMEADEAEVYA